ncbi:hypothetical protein [Lysinibacillus sp. K60]|uniref:hypothetical protein n=1 Tax=Lysinibacillus sp. K60 TaxID=2720027 RepID=UPI001C8CD3D5|nr:hypothetical protein [Lysinibacillus sp. K60]MBX8946836.1 hypothetical protein [Lysinibacillus sp. K60]
MIALITERWLSSKRATEFVHDGQVGVSEPVKGQPLSKIRKQLAEEVASSVEVKPLVLRQYFLQQGNVADANRVEQVDVTTIRVKGGLITNELSFIGASFLEGFLSVYGIELERAVRRYEEKLQLFETLDHERKQRAIFIGRLKHGELEQLSPSFETEQQAKIQLEAMKQVEKERALAPSLEVERDE